MKNVITIRSRHVGRDVDIVDSRRFRRRPLRHQRRLGKRRRCVRHCSIVRWRWRRRRRWCRSQRRPVSKFDAAKIWEDLIFLSFSRPRRSSRSEQTETKLLKFFAQMDHSSTRL